MQSTVIDILKDLNNRTYHDYFCFGVGIIKFNKGRLSLSVRFFMHSTVIDLLKDLNKRTYLDFFCF